jgi:ketosteroid isomerase-like protein
MHDRNVEIARSVIEAFNRGDTATILRSASADVEVFSAPDLANSGSFRGVEGYLEWTGQWLEAWDEFSIVLLEVDAVDDRHVVTAARQLGHGALSGIDIDMPVAHLFEIDGDGKIVRFELHTTRDSALARVRPQSA